MMKLSVVIPAYDRLPDVLACLNSLQAFQATADVEYLVQDDCSPGCLFPAMISPRVASVARNASNLGFSGNCNMGAARATGDILFFVNQDVTGAYNLSEGWDAALISAFDDAQVGIVGARLLFPNGSIQSAGGLFDAAGAPFHRCLGYADFRYKEVNEPREVGWVTGAALAIRAATFFLVGGFSPAYGRGYFEDVDLSMTIRGAGLKVMYEPRVTLVHPAGSTGGNPRFTENARLFKSRWVDTGIVKPDVPVQKVRYW
jgi:GT2 family glycosyltransferase